MFDLQPEDSLKAWYATIGRQAWRLEEFQHYYGNATFDDEATKHCAEFLLRIYLEKKDETFGRRIVGNGKQSAAGHSIRKLF